MDNDGSYKRIFSEPQMVRDLLRGFIRQDWVKDVDFSTLTRIKHRIWWRHCLPLKMRSRNVLY